VDCHTDASAASGIEHMHSHEEGLSMAAESMSFTVASSRGGLVSDADSHEDQNRNDNTTLQHLLLLLPHHRPCFRMILE
jgi:hypothetical protein